MSSPIAHHPVCRLLLVEDSPDLLASLYGCLEPLGHMFDSATNGFAERPIARTLELRALPEPAPAAATD